MPEKYKPSEEDINKAEAIMADESMVKERRMSKKRDNKILSQLIGTEKDGYEDNDLKFIRVVEGKNLFNFDYHTDEQAGRIYFYDGKRLPIEYFSPVDTIEFTSGRWSEKDYSEGSPYRSPDEVIDFITWSIENKKDPVEKEVFDQFKEEQKERREKFNQEIEKFFRDNREVMNLVNKDPEYLDKFNLRDILKKIPSAKFRLLIEYNTPTSGDIGEDWGIYDSKEEAEKAAKEIIKKEYGGGQALDLYPKIEEMHEVKKEPNDA